MDNPYPHSEDWLAFLCWGLELLINPAPYKFLSGYEAWYYQNWLRPQLRQLERAKMLRRYGPRAHPVMQLTERGRLAACGGIDPVQQWQRPWDGKWRLLIFDLPVGSHTLRVKLWRWLRSQRFGFLQKSAWLWPDTIKGVRSLFQRFEITPEALTIVEGRPTDPDSDADLVKGAWDFAAINHCYETVLGLAAEGLELAGRPGEQALSFRQWLAAEREAWMTALSQDPLLPEALLPAGYLGRQAWEQRQSVYAALAKRGHQ